jgi:hypothetical protein
MNWKKNLDQDLVRRGKKQAGKWEMKDGSSVNRKSRLEKYAH